MNTHWFHPSRWMQKVVPTYLMQQFCKQSRAAGCTVTAATRRPQPSWWRRHRLAAPWCLETCRASCCSPQVCHPPSSQIQLKGKKRTKMWMRLWIWGTCQYLMDHVCYGSLLSLLSRRPNHTLWWMKPKDHSCSRTKRFSFSVSMVKTSVLLPRKFREHQINKKKSKTSSLTKYCDWLDVKTWRALKIIRWTAKHLFSHLKRHYLLLKYPLVNIIGCTVQLNNVFKPRLA